MSAAAVTPAGGGSSGLGGAASGAAGSPSAFAAASSLPTGARRSSNNSSSGSNGGAPPPAVPGGLLCSPAPVHILFGHVTGVTAVDVRAELGVVASTGSDGTLLLHDLGSGTLLRRMDVGEVLAGGKSGPSTVRPVPTSLHLSADGHIVVTARTAIAVCTVK